MKIFNHLSPYAHEHNAPVKTYIDESLIDPSWKDKPKSAPRHSGKIADIFKDRKFKEACKGTCPI